jgi:hypothetical protein
MKLFWLNAALLSSVILASAQAAPKSVSLTDKSDVPADDISKSLRKECPNVSIVKDATKRDYTLEAVKTNERTGLHIQVDHEFAITLFDHDGNTFSSASDESLNYAVKALCHAIKTSMMVVEVVDIRNLTQSTDVRGDTSGGVIGAVVNAAAGRNTHTDSASINVIVNGEHALLDCYEHATGCTTIGPGTTGSRKATGSG